MVSGNKVQNMVVLNSLEFRSLKYFIPALETLTYLYVFRSVSDNAFKIKSFKTVVFSTHSITPILER